MLYATVLAGGKSLRMGQNKAQLSLEGGTLLDRAVELLKSAGAEPILISGQVDGYKTIPDLLPNSGPLGGLYSTLDYIRNSYGLDGSELVLIPVDMPMLKVESIQKLLEAATNATCCHYEGEVFPCVFKTTTELYCHLRDLFAEGTELGGRRSMNAILNYFGAKIIHSTPEQAGEFRNANTPEDWKDITRQFASN
ncbi:MAG: molybdenum cofactor guanylyltransferase [Pseudomonadota bacterium]